MAGLSPWESAGRTKASLDPELVFALINQWEANGPHSHTPVLGVCLCFTASVNSVHWGDKTNTQTVQVFSTEGLSAMLQPLASF